MKPNIVIDFDGTIVDHAYPAIGPFKRGAKEALIQLNKYFTIHVSSCRNNRDLKDNHDQHYLKQMQQFLSLNGLDFCKIDYGDAGKVVATAYIDDRAIEFRDNWEAITDYLCQAVK